jgi:hypothetical protein
MEYQKSNFACGGFLLADLVIGLAGLAVTLLFGSGSIPISVVIPGILTEVFRGFPQSLQLNFGIVPQLGHD